uniref:Uncharacterized protein n=1 Tax=Amphora coffeiformis TaxID=265554 RepID=A0A7S3LE99_9STRA|mmetsp:Transcript_9757/g.18667  ORF Transcript_9757/g.18667 Transcript_9757/m.18667 type:complete len:187 (-) Transcript_9757:110-670(-)|eukprot:scaffold1149_cov165-Amphora_coffeaeformis.AAC.7
MTFTISIAPGQPIKRQPIPTGLDGQIWDDFCDTYDAIVVHPYRRAKLLIVVSFLALLLFIMGAMTLTGDNATFLPTGTAFLVGPCVFLIIAAGAAVYMYGVYPRVSHDLEELCQQATTTVSSSSSSADHFHGIAVTFHYCHNDARHDLSEHVIQIAPLPDIETAVPATEEWNNPLLRGHKPQQQPI